MTVLNTPLDSISTRRINAIFILLKHHLHDNSFISSNNSSTSLIWLLKILSFLSLYTTQITACQIIQRPFRLFLFISSSFQQAIRVNKLGGVIKEISINLKTLNQTSPITLQCRKRWVDVSSPPPHNTQLIESPGLITLRNGRLTHTISWEGYEKLPL